ncbi:ABC transporter substrate-binding protein [Rhodoferax sp.]|uniref:ABC transporter substrate-binding protein n=1 Tax=Rhodoferax sp. TaxID=50421 RepID=UPI0026325F6F|nr:ABC transporter substrate-binding protein [Rhodoferax sp.]MDD5479991.1 ABC transporter substrate-binding protein [Rhodoferax sp.]
MNKTLIHQWLGCAVLGLCAVVSQAQAQTATPVRIGWIGPLTGPSADFGVPMLNGAKLAVEEINAAGGYLGRPIELVIKDDTGVPDVGLARAQELITDKVAATVGFCNTGVAMKALPVFQTAKMPLIVPCATGTPITEKYPAPESFIFRTSARDAIQAPFVVEDIVSRGWTRVAVFADTTGYGEAGLQDVIKALAAKNLKPAYIARFALGVKDLSQELKAAQAANADVVFSYTVGPENAVIALGRKAMGWKVPQVGAWPLSFPFFIDGAKDAAEGALMAQTFIAEPSNERRRAFLSAYARKYQVNKITVPMAAAQAYDTVYILTYAILGIRNGDLSGVSIKAALEHMQRVYYGVTATHQNPFAKDDKDAVSMNMLVMGMVKNGTVTFAYPQDKTKNLFVQRKK